MTASKTAHGCIAFLQKGTTAHNGKFIEYIAPDGTLYNNVNNAIKGIVGNPGGRLTYLHWNLKPLGGGRFELVQEVAVKTDVTNLRLLP